MNSAQQFTGHTFNLGALAVRQASVEPCKRLVQWGKGLPITCACSRCLIRNQTPAQAKASMDVAHGV